MKEPIICSKCILPETFPGVVFDERGQCNHCRRGGPSHDRISERKKAYRDRLDELIGDIRGKAPVYDVIMAYSGGKDSSYTLKLLKERYDLRILALTFDNHFVSSTAFNNIRTVVDFLKIDSLTIRIPWPAAKRLFALTAQQDIFPKPTLLRASSICTACIGLVKSLVLKSALEMFIPFVAFGWSPGQAPIQSAIMRQHPDMVEKNQRAFKAAFPDRVMQEIERYCLPDEYYKNVKDRFPYNIHPLAFFDYDEQAIARDLTGIGWKFPEDTDTNSSNCLLNAYANHCHLIRHGFHPYVWEIANMVRQGIVERSEGINKIYTDQCQVLVKYGHERLFG